MIYRPLLRSVVGAVVVALVVAGMPAPVNARVVTTEEALAASATLSSTPISDRAALDALLARDEVRAQFEALGVDPAQARERVHALDDQQVRELAAHLEQLPAGSGVLGVLLVVFIVLLVTDILGFTRIFPFTRPIR